jgi:hypothetical protein
MQSVVSERIGLALDDCHSIPVWSSSPRTDVLGHSQSDLSKLVFCGGSTHPSAPTLDGSATPTLSSRPERSAVEGPAVRLDVKQRPYQ